MRRSILYTLLLALPFVLLACSESSLPAEDAPPTTAPDTASAEPIVDTVALNYSITGMHCQGCVDSIIGTVAKLEGVASCEVSLENESAVITVADAALEDTIIETIKGLGYTVTVAGQETDSGVSDETISESTG